MEVVYGGGGERCGRVNVGYERAVEKVRRRG